MRAEGFDLRGRGASEPAAIVSFRRGPCLTWWLLQLSIAQMRGPCLTWWLLQLSIACTDGISATDAWAVPDMLPTCGKPERGPPSHPSTRNLHAPRMPRMLDGPCVPRMPFKLEYDRRPNIHPRTCQMIGPSSRCLFTDIWPHSSTRSAPRLASDFASPF